MRGRGATAHKERAGGLAPALSRSSWGSRTRGRRPGPAGPRDLQGLHLLARVVRFVPVTAHEHGVVAAPAADVVRLVVADEDAVVAAARVDGVLAGAVT